MHTGIVVTLLRMPDESDNSEAREPLGIYQSGKITFYKSFVESNAADLEYFARLTPVECLQQLHRLLTQVHKDELKRNHSLGTRIFFD